MKKINKYSGRKLLRSERNQKGNFTQISNSFILNPDIRNSDLRLLLYIMSNKDYRIINTKDCMMYLNKTKPVINGSFERLIELGILIITDDIIEVVIPEEMKKYKVGYLKGNEKGAIEVKKTLPSETQEIINNGKENFTTEVKKTLPSGKENYTKEVKKTYKKPLETIDNVYVTNPITLNNTRVLPVSAKSGDTEQSHSNYNTKENTGIELDLERDSLQSQATPSVLAPSLHTPKEEKEKVGKELSLPTGDNYSGILPIEDHTIPSEEEISQPSVEPEPLPIEPENNTSIEEKNDLNLIIENISHFKLLYDNAKWGDIDISNFSNAYISHLIIEKEKKNVDETISSKTYYFISMLIKYSSIMENDSKLWLEFQSQCKSENRLDIISKYTHNSMKN